MPWGAYYSQCLEKRMHHIQVCFKTMLSNTRVKPAAFSNDAAFDAVYPERIRELSKHHWTPLSIARKAAQFLAHKPGASILDIGSGVGKFCLAAGYHQPGAHFYGVEQREALHEVAKTAQISTGVQNVEFLHGNFTQLDLNAYDGFYFYNAFFENLDQQRAIANDIAHSVSLYTYYSHYLFKALEKAKSGTRLVSFHSLEDEIPQSYHLVDISDDQLLKMWIRR